MRSLNQKIPFLSALLLASATLSHAANDLIVIDVSGAAGNSGKDGTSYSGSAGRSSDGRNGGHATEAVQGQDAGTIKTILKEASSNGAPVPGTLVLEGHQVTAVGKNGKIENQILIGENGYLILKSAGGKGGNGGNGGNGEDGGRGSDGSDATRYSSGTNGGPGGDGGNAGNATSGQNGGKGGKIEVTVRADETHLLMLLKTEVSGGSGGAAGANGQPGSGGSGGSGGSSYSWTEEESYTDWETDSEGNSKSVTKTRTTFHSNPGGSDGSSGSRGHSASANPSSGKNGADGQYSIAVIEGGHTSIYASRYDLKLVDFKVRTADHDAIFEPGEDVEVYDLRIRNTGQMPMPLAQNARIYLATSEWIVSDGQELNLPLPNRTQEPSKPRTLAPGEEIILNGPLKFKIKKTTVAQDGEAFVTSDTIQPLSYMERVNRPFTEFPNGKTIQIEFPIEFGKITALRTLDAGGATRFSVKITNKSKKPLGSKTELARQISASLNLSGGEIKPHQIKFWTGSGQTVSPLAGLIETIALLGPGESVDFMGTIGFGPEVRPLESISLQFGLDVTSVGGGQEMVRVHNRMLTLSRVEAYAKPQTQSLLLVTGNRTTKAEVEAWRSQAKSLGYDVAIWNLSATGYLDLGAPLGSGSTSLMDDFKNGTVIFLDDPMEIADQTERTIDYLPKRQFLKAAAQNGVHFYFVGPKGLTSVQDFYETTFGDVDQGFNGIKRYLRSERTEVPIALTDFTASFDTIEVYSFHWGREPDPRKLSNRARQLLESLSALHPDRRYEIVMRPKPELRSRFGLFSRSSLGTLEVRRTLDAATGSATGMQVAEAAARSPKFIESAENKYGLISAMSVPQKLDLLTTILDQSAAQEFNAGLADILFPILRETLGSEQAVLRVGEWWDGMSRSQIEAKLPVLKALAELDWVISDLRPGTPAGDAVIDLVSELLAYSRSQFRVWDHVWSLRRNRMVSLASEDLIWKFIAKAFPGSTRVLGGFAERPVDSAAYAAIHAKVDEIMKKWARERSGAQLTRRQQGSQLVMPAQSNVVRDQSILGSPTDRIFDGNDHDKRGSFDSARESRQLDSMLKNQDTRSRLTAPCGEGGIYAPAKPQAEGGVVSDPQPGGSGSLDDFDPAAEALKDLRIKAGSQQ